MVEKLLEEVPRSLLPQSALLNVLNAGKRTCREILDKVCIQPSGILRLVLSPCPIDLSHCLWVESGPLDEHIAIVLYLKHHFLALPVLEGIVE